MSREHATKQTETTHSEGRESKKDQGGNLEEIKRNRGARRKGKERWRVEIKIGSQSANE